jgi:hypothetical protein
MAMTRLSLTVRSRETDTSPLRVSAMFLQVGTRWGQRIAISALCASSHVAITRRRSNEQLARERPGGDQGRNPGGQHDPLGHLSGGAGRTANACS